MRRIYWSNNVCAGCYGHQRGPRTRSSSAFSLASRYREPLPNDPRAFDCMMIRKSLSSTYIDSSSRSPADNSSSFAFSERAAILKPSATASRRHRSPKPGVRSRRLKSICWWNKGLPNHSDPVESPARICSPRRSGCKMIPDPEALNLVQAALPLPADGRSELAERLFPGLDPSHQAELEFIWQATIDERLREIDQGEVKLISRNEAIPLIDIGDPNVA